MKKTDARVAIVWSKYSWDFILPVLKDEEGVLLVEIDGSLYEIDSLEIVADSCEYAS